MSNYERVLYQSNNAIAQITLNRPEKRNALDEKTVTELRRAIHAAGLDSEIHVIVLDGAGTDFCSGADLESLRTISTATVSENVQDARNLSDLFVQMRRTAKPIVAVVKGRALAGGCGLASACDLVLASQSAQFGYPEVSIGFIPAIVMTILRRNVSEKRAFELIASGEIISAEHAQNVGLINRVFSDSAFESEVETYLGKLAAKSQSAVSACKSLLYHMDSLGFEAAVEAGVQLNALTRMTEDCKKGVERFLKKV